VSSATVWATRETDVTHDVVGPLGDIEMNHRASDRVRGRRTTLALGAALLLAVAVAAPAAAGGQGAIVVRGIQDEYGSCEDHGDAGYLMTGDLQGCWVVETFVVKSQFDGKAHLMATGVERFSGSIGTVQDTFRTRYVYTSKPIGDWTSFLEVHGRCHHPITGGGDGFAGISGELSFTDVVDTNPPYYPYWGSIRLDGASSALSTAASATTTAGTSGSNGVTC
jgi:hypothetical protein